MRIRKKRSCSGELHSYSMNRRWACRESTERTALVHLPVIMDRAEPFIRESAKAKKPFFAIVWFHTPHLPVVAGIQPASHKASECVSARRRQADRYGFVRGRTADALDRTDHVLAVLAGFALTSLRPELLSGDPSAHLEALVVAPDHRGLGLGRSLVEATEAEASRRGARSLTLHVLGLNHTARRL